MIRVACVTTWQEIAGEYEYARNLIEYVEKVDPEIKVTPIRAPFQVSALLQEVKDYDVVHLNFCFGPHAPLTDPANLRLFGRKRVVLTFHENNPQDSRSTHPFLNEAARVVVHEKNSQGFIFIPHGIPVVEPCLWSPENRAIGTSGFPFATKRYPLIAEAASILSQNSSGAQGLRIQACASGHADTFSMKSQIERTFPSVEYVIDWWEQKQVLEFLSRNLVNVYVCNSSRLGPSGSVRLGLATGSHIVLSRSMMHRDLFEYEDEVEFVDEPVTGQEIASAVRRVVESGKRPKRVLEDQSWMRSGKLYAEVFRSVL